MKYLKTYEDLNSYKKFIQKYKKSDYISVKDRKRLASGDVKSNIFERIEYEVKESLDLLNLINVDNLLDFLIGVEDETYVVVADRKVSFSLIIDTREMSSKFFDSLEQWNIPLSLDMNGEVYNAHASQYLINHGSKHKHDHLKMDVLGITDTIINNIESLKKSKIDSYKLNIDMQKVRKSDYFSTMMYRQLDKANIFENIKVIPVINIRLELQNDSEDYGLRDILKQSINSQVIDRLFRIEGIPNTYLTEYWQPKYGYTDRDKNKMDYIVKINI